MAAVVLLALFLSASQAGQRGVVTLATVSPPVAQAGTPVSVSVTGKNPCGAVHIDWGDGTAITYAIVDLTTTQRHTYTTPGKYNVVARGMGNCDGETNVGVRIDPAPAAPQRPQISSFAVSLPAPAGSPLGVTAYGKGTCRFRVDFGDGGFEELTAPLPHTVRHVYSRPGTYTLTVNPSAPCEGRHSFRLDIGGDAPAPRLTGIKAAPNPVAARARLSFTVEGSGACPVTVDFGDGNDQAVTAALPATISHAYARPGVYQVFAWSEQPCAGEAKTSVRVRSVRR